MNLKLTQEHVTEAVTGGLDLLDPEKELVDVYRRHSSGLVILRSILEAIAVGQIVLTAPTPPEGAELPPGAGNPETPDDD